MITVVVGNEANQEKLLPTCTNVMADCQNSVSEENKHQAVCLWSESGALGGCRGHTHLAWVNSFSFTGGGLVIHRITESSGLGKTSKVQQQTVSPAATSASLPHPHTGHNTSLVLHSSRDQSRQQNLRGTAIFPEKKKISFLLLSGF